MTSVAPLDQATDAAADGELEARLVRATLEALARWGVGKTTADDVARLAGVSRATLYRTFPGGKEVLLDAVLRTETARLGQRLTARLAAVTDLEDLLVTAALEAATVLHDHDALGYVLRHEPERLLPAFAFHRLDGVLRTATAFAAPQLARFVPAEVAERGAEWAVRLLLSYALDPSPHLDLGDSASVRAFVRAYVLPVLVPTTACAPQGA